MKFCFFVILKICFKKLNLSKNKLDEKSFPSTLRRLVFLEELNLSGNCLTEIPPFVFTLPRLKVLHLAENKILKISPQIGNLISLERLYLGNNQLKDIPRQVICHNFSKIYQIY